MTEPRVGSPASPGGLRVRALAPALLVVSLVIQCVVLYSPQGPGVSPFPLSDKVVHLLVFAAPAALALLAGFRPALVVALLGAQAVLSEVLQAEFLPGRSGDPLDVVADLAGVGLAVVAVGWWVRSRGPSRG